MSVPMAYGDSRSYFRTQSDADVIRRMQQQAAQQAAFGGGQFNSQIAAMNPYANAYALMRNVTPPKDPTTPDRVIADQGFGGAESRPRSRRYRK